MEALGTGVILRVPTLFSRRFRAIFIAKKSVLLSVHEFAVSGALRIEFRMVPRVGDATRIHDENPVGSDDGGEAVRDDERGPSFHQRVERFLDSRFGTGVEGGGRFVEYEDVGVRDDGAGDGNALFLSAGEFETAFPYHGFEPVR